MIPEVRDLGRYDRAEWYQERIEIQIAGLAKELEEGEQIMVHVILSDGQRVQATWFGYHNPNMLVIDGLDDKGRSVRLLAAHTNVQNLFTIMPRGEAHEGPRIGFQQRTENE